MEHGYIRSDIILAKWTATEEEDVLIFCWRFHKIIHITVIIISVKDNEENLPICFLYCYWLKKHIMCAKVNWWASSTHAVYSVIKVMKAIKCHQLHKTAPAEKLTGPLQLKKFPAFYAPRKVCYVYPLFNDTLKDRIWRHWDVIFSLISMLFRHAVCLLKWGYIPSYSHHRQNADTRPRSERNSNPLSFWIISYSPVPHDHQNLFYCLTENGKPSGTLPIFCLWDQSKCFQL